MKNGKTKWYNKRHKTNAGGRGGETAPRFRGNPLHCKFKVIPYIKVRGSNRNECVHHSLTNCVNTVTQDRKQTQWSKLTD